MRLSRRAWEKAAERRRERQSEPGYQEWHQPHSGKCQACRQPGPLIRHHVVTEQLVRRCGGEPWDIRNALDLGAPRMWGGRCDCHDLHHHPGARDTRISVTVLSAANVEYARELLGDDGARAYFDRRYQA